MKPGDTVQITKLFALQDNKDMRVGYAIKGYIAEPIELGQPLLVWRTERNGIQAEGIFRTSPLVFVAGLEDGSWYIATENSSYHAVLIPASEGAKDTFMEAV